MAIRAGSVFVDVEPDFRKLNKGVAGAARNIDRKLGGAMRSPAFRAAGAQQAKTLRQVGTAAKWSGAAIAAGVVIETKRAISEWRESVKVGRQTAAVLRSTGGAAKVSGREVDALSQKVSRKAGIDDEAVQSAANLLLTFTKVRNETGKGNQVFSRAIPAITDMSVALGQDLNSSVIQVGKALNDPIKGMTALRRVGVSFTQEQQDRVKGWVEEGQLLRAQKFILRELNTEFRGSAAAQADSFDKARVGIENLEESLGEIIGPPLSNFVSKVSTRLIPVLDRTGDQLDKIWDRKDMDLGEKLTASRAVIRRNLSPVVKEARAVIGRMNLGDKLSAAFEKAVPAMAEAAARAAPRAVAAFFRAWNESNIWGKLLIGGVLMKKLGGFAAFRALGRQGGAAMGTGMADGAATQTAKVLPGRFGKLKGQMRGIGKGVLWTALFAGIADGATRSNLTFSQRAHQALSTATLGLLPAPQEMSEKLRERIQFAMKMGAPAVGDSGMWDWVSRGLDDKGKDLIGKLRPLREYAIKNFGPQARLRVQVAVNPGQALRNLRELKSSFAGMKNGAILSMRELRTTTERNMKIIRNVLGIHSAAGRKAVNTNFGLAVREIRSAMQRGQISTGEGMREIRRLFRVHTGALKGISAKNFGDVVAIIRRRMSNAKGITKEGLEYIEKIFTQRARAFGLSPGDAKAKGRQQAYRLRTGDEPLQTGRQRGGYMTGGKPSGDSIPALLERGEYVINRKAVRRLGKRKLDAINYGIPRFQGGGIVALGRRLQKEGFQVGEHPAFGGVGGHAPNSYHYRGMAIDVNADGARGGEKSKLDGLYRRLKGMKGVVELLWQVADHFDHLHVAMSGKGGRLGPGGGGGGVFNPIKRLLVQGPDSPIKAITQQALDVVRGGANTRLKSAAGSSTTEGKELTDGGGGSNRAIGKRMAAKMGWTGGQWRALQELWTRESGWSNTARNPSSGAFGIPQALPPGKMGAAAAGGDAVAQIRWGLNYIKGRYGSPAAALAFHDSHNWYQQGGLVEMLQRGGGARGNLGQMLSGFLGGKGKARSRALSRLLGRIKKTALPKAMKDKIAGLTKAASISGEMATRAGQLTVDGGAQGIVGGMTESGWLQKQLSELFKLRNQLVEAHEFVVARRELMAKLLARSKKSLARARKHPRRNKALIGGLKKVIGGLNTRRGALNTARGDLLTSLEEVQGLGAPMGRLRALPGLGTLGGSIFETQMRLRELATPSTVTDTTAGDESGQLEMTRQLLREANLRTAVSERHFDVLKDLPPFGGSFAQGGVVPGPAGAPRVIVAHGGETVLPEGANRPMQVVVVVEDGAVDRNKIRVIAKDEAQTAMRREGRSVGRTPGSAGVLG